jgi:hypothetical protein
MKKTILFLVMALALTTQTLLAQVPSYVPTNGLVGYWPFNGNANDESGNGNLGMLLPGVSYSNDRYNEENKSLLIDGIDGGVPNNMITNKGAVLPTTIQSNSDFTISAWFKITDLTKGVASSTPTNSFTSQTILCGLPFNSFGLSFNHPYAPNKIMSCLGSFCGPSNPVSWDFSNQLDWHHILVRKTSNNYSYFLDGTIVNSTNLNFNFALTSLQIGGIPVSTGEVFSGHVDDIGIWNRALTQQEITNLYNSSLPQTACLPANVPTNGLVGYWPFCGNANDESGNGNNGTVNGATVTTDRFGNANSAYNFDGVDDFIQVPNSNSISITGDITMAAWVNTLGYNNQNYQTILSKRETYWTWEYNMTLSYHTNIVHDTKLIASRALGMGNGQQVWSTNSYIPNNWEYWVATISNGQLKLYKNGVLDTTQPFTLVPNNQNCPLLFGKNTLSDNSEQFLGKIDDIGIWNRALTQEEITNLYNVNQCITNITVTDTLIINVGQLSFNEPVTWANNITIAPNPASSQININFNNITNLNGGTLKIINSLGQEVATTPITTSGTNSTMQLTTWGGTGMYFVQIINPQGQIVDIKKIILQ